MLCYTHTLYYDPTDELRSLHPCWRNLPRLSTIWRHQACAFCCTPYDVTLGDGVVLPFCDASLVYRGGSGGGGFGFAWL